MTQWPLQSQCDTFYGNPRMHNDPSKMSAAWHHANIVYVPCPWVLWTGRGHTARIAIHRKCADSLARVLQATWNGLGKSQSAIEKQSYHVFSGSVVFRTMRTNPRKLSMHSYGCAIDWDAPDNMLGDRTPEFAPDEPLLAEFRREGWICGRDWRGNSIDAMHVQAARVD